MEIDRKTLLEALKTVEPALSARDLLPLLQKIWFTGSMVQATDGTIGIEAPLQTDFTGGIPGSVLIGFVESLGRDTLKTTADDKSVTLQSEGSRIKLPLEPTANNVWPFGGGNAEPDAEIGLDENWRQALAFAMLSVTNNTNHDERRGITFEGNKSAVNLYATDSVSMAWAHMEQSWELDRACVPGDFVKEVLRLMATGGKMLFRGAAVEAENEANIHVYSKLFEVAEPTKYKEKIKQLLGKAEFVPLPDGLRPALERAELLKDTKDGIQAKFEFTDKDLLVVQAGSSYGDLKEELYLEEAHPEVEAKQFTPSFVLRALEGRDMFLVSDRCLILSGPAHLTYICAAYRAK